MSKSISKIFFPGIRPFHKILIVTVSCIALTLITYIQDIASMSVKGQPVYYWQTFIFHIKWLIWIPFTFLALRLAHKFPVKLKKTTHDIIRHIGIAVLFTIVFNIVMTIVILVLVYFFSGILFDYFNPKKYIIANWVYNFHYEMIIYLLIVTVYNGLQYLLKYREETITSLSLKNQVAIAQNQLLKMQMQPHFLFNTHHSIISLMSLNKTRQAAEMLTKLSDLLRKTLDMPNKEFVTLREEMDLVKLYLDIQLIRFEDRLQIKYILPEETLPIKIPVFILQPIVENAIRHGIEPVSYAGCIIISSFLKQQALLLKIEDDGAGYNRNNRSKGIGINNINERLKNHFGDTYSLIIAKREPRGTVTEVEIPLIK